MYAFAFKKNYAEFLNSMFWHTLLQIVKKNTYVVCICLMPSL